MDWNLVVTVCVFVEGLLILRGLIELSRQIEDGLEELDTTLAGAITSVVEKFGGGEGFEQINPIQQAIAQLLTDRVSSASQNPGVIDVITRGSDGKFSAKNSNND